MHTRVKYENIYKAVRIPYQKASQHRSPQVTITTARTIAYDALVATIEQNKKPEEALERLYAKQKKTIKKLDRSFITEILYGSLRWYSKLYWILQNTSNRDLDKSSGEIKAALVAGTYQIYYMSKVPDRAAVNESVEYIRARGQASACSFVNGILRQIARRGEYFPKPDKIKQPEEYLALQYAHPRWIVRRWSKQFKFERLSSMLSNNNHKPPLTIRSNLNNFPIAEIGKLQEGLLRTERTHSDKRPLRSALRLKEFPSTETESLFGQGNYTFQDESSQLIGLLVDPSDKETIVDACAGPGGKLSHIYELANEDAATKSTIIAIEKSKRQLIRAQETCERLAHKNIEWIESDFLKWNADQQVDKILLDAPCSGLGVLHRHPEGKWQKTEKAIADIVLMQQKMVKHALNQLKVGGSLIYSVCSFEADETTDQLKWVLETYQDAIEVVSPVHFIPDYYKKYVTRDNILMIYSGNQDQMDGFGAFIVKKVKNFE